MSTILSDADVADIQSQVAPQIGDDICEVWRMPRSSTPVAGGVGVGKYGTPVVGGTNVLRPDQKPVKSQTLYCRKNHTPSGSEPTFAGQTISLEKWLVQFNGADNPDIQGGDWLVFIAKREENQRLDDLGWKANTIYIGNTNEQPTVSNGNRYRVLVAGLSGTVEPTWPTFKGQTVVDGGVTWLCEGKRLRLEVVNPGGEDTIYVERVVECKYAGASEVTT